MIPLAWSIVKSASLPERSVASALVVTSAFEMAMIPGFGTLTGSTTGLLFVPLLRDLGLQISWIDYAKAAALPALLCSILVLIGNILVIRPEVQLGADLFRSRDLTESGMLSRDEKWTFAIVGCSVALWATQRLHRFDEGSIALLAIIVLLTTGVLKPREFENGISWGLVIFIGTTLTILKVIPAYGIDKLVSSLIISNLGPYLVNPTMALLALAMAVLALRIIEPAGAVSTMVAFIALYGPLSKLCISHLASVVGAVLAFSPFWFLYQNIWIMMTDGLTEHKAFTRSQQTSMATIYAVAVMVSVILSIHYWRAVALISK